MSSVFLLVVGAVIVAVIAFMLRQAGGGAVERSDTTEADPPTGEDGDSALAHEVADGEEVEDEDEAAGHIALSSDGFAFLPRAHDVLISPRETSAASELPPEHRVSIVLQVGDLIGTRVVRGAPDVDPWRLETLGRDRDLTEWSFETEEGARAAQETLERLVVRPPFDAEGEPVPIGDEDFWVAEQERLRTHAEIELPDEPEEEPYR